MQGAFLVEQVPAVRYAEAAGGESFSVLGTVLFGDADQQLPECAQR